MNASSRARHFSVAGVFFAIVALLLVEGFTTKTVGTSGTRETSSTDLQSSPLAGSRPVMRAWNGRLVPTGSAPGRRVALTFDDGPDPVWTPRIASILVREHVPATFFEVGSMVVRHPDLTAMLHRDGFVIGNHTFTHVDPATLPAWQRSAQIAATEAAVAGITHSRPTLVRPPYSSTPDAVTRQQLAAWSSIARDGYLIALSNFDTNDWDRPGVSSIVASVVNSSAVRRGAGGVVLMHDAGGNRSQTVAALPKLISALRARGFSFVSVPQIAGIPTSMAEAPATSWQVIRGQIFDWLLRMAGWLTALLTLLVLGVTITSAVRMAISLALARVQLKRSRHRLIDPDFLPPVSVIVPAFNESVCIERTVRSLVGSHYAGSVEVIVVDDGSTDDTAGIVERLALPIVRVERLENGGKAAALNHGIRLSTGDIIVTVDGDTVFETDTIAHLTRRFSDAAVGAVSGNTKVGNRNSILGRWQHIDYVMGFNLDRRMYEVLRCTPTVPGAVGAFRRQALADIGGVSGETIAEDTDVTLDIGRAGWDVVYEHDARAWTEAPATLRALYRQRSRWAFGTFQSVWKHRAALWQRGAGAPGRRAVAMVALIQIATPLCAPLIDLFAIYSVIFLDPWPILAFWIAFNSFQFVLAWVAFGYDHESRRPLWALPLQQFVWRQIMYLVVLNAVIAATLGTKIGWRHAKRTGDVVVLAEGT